MSILPLGVLDQSPVRSGGTYPFTPNELAMAQHARRRTVVGAPEDVRDRLLDLARAYAADELIVVTITHDPKARRRSYELLAQVFGLTRHEGEEP